MEKRCSTAPGRLHDDRACALALAVSEAAKQQMGAHFSVGVAPVGYVDPWGPECRF